VVSGGHTSLYLVKTPGEYQLLGRTRDDAAGEAYDKVAKLLSLGYPGGPILDRLAADGNDTAIRWPGTRLTNPDRNAPERDGRFDFSFSGLKTAVLRHVRQRQAELGAEQLPPPEIADLAASFQRRVVETLIEKAFAAARWHGAKSIGIAGGVSANSRLRKEALAKAERSEIPVYIPRLSLSTDNAAMIAAAGLRKLATGQIASADLNAAASLPL
jgi:N6-L-threonylcarbamoyladenine synthase